ncbi:hypothetical protein BJX70DRAFT_397923 [Aspergillus crustosus]
MSPADRLKLLFAEDEALLQIDSGLRWAPPAAKPTAPVTTPLPEIPGFNIKQLEQLKISVDNSKNSIPSEVLDSPPSPHDGTFCPLTAVSKFPYHHIRGELMQKVAGKFFDKGQFFARRWDLYYIHAPDRVGGRPLLLVPSCQVRKLLREANLAFQCSLSLPPEEEKGLVLRFNCEGFPQPTFQGHSDSREDKDHLEATIPVKSNLGLSQGTTAEQLIAFESMMEAAVASAKSKTKSKAKKQRLRVQRNIDTSDTIRRAECYLGLRKESTDLIDCKWDALPSPSLEPKSLSVDKPIPHPFWGEPVFISIDIEVNERCHTQITEVGISALDTRDLIGIAPGLRGEEWQSRIQSRHLRVKEYRHHVNQLYIRGCPEAFEFGTSEWVASADVPNAVHKSFAHPSYFDGEKLRPLVLVGHNLDADIQYLHLANVHVIEDSNGASKFSDRIDTAAAFQMIRGETEPRSLAYIIGELGMTGWNLHNAGNDARYTLQALVAMLVIHNVPDAQPQDAKPEDVQPHEANDAGGQDAQEA